MKFWPAVIIVLAVATVAILGACSTDRPQYSADDVIQKLTEWQNSSFKASLIEWDRYGADLVGLPVVMHFKLDDWDAEYEGNGKWLVSAEASYYEGEHKTKCECTWYFYEDNDKIEYAGNGEYDSS